MLRLSFRPSSKNALQNLKHSARLFQTETLIFFLLQIRICIAIFHSFLNSLRIIVSGYESFFNKSFIGLQVKYRNSNASFQYKKETMGQKKKNLLPSASWGKYVHIKFWRHLKYVCLKYVATSAVWKTRLHISPRWCPVNFLF